MTDPILPLDYLTTLPPEWGEDLLPGIQRELKHSSYKVVVLDDDPTGTQTVRDIPVLTRWNVKELEEELTGDIPAFYILTNSRSLTEPRACELAAEIGTNLKAASDSSGVRIVVISRSDSTLRGHFPSEVAANARVLGKDHLPYLVLPFFLEGGRYTINDIHYVKEGESLVPAAQTPFARDAAFGFKHSNLRFYIEEKTGGRIKADAVTAVSIDDIRTGGPERVAGIFRSVARGSACFVNAASYRDMEVIVTALIEVEKQGYEFLYRSAASFVRTRIGIDASSGLLPGRDLVSDSDKGGLFVIGSYVPKTTKQVAKLFELTDIEQIEVQVSALLEDDRKEQEIGRVIELAETTIKGGRDAAIFTSRMLVAGSDAESSLKIGQIVSDSLVKIVAGISVQPRYLVAKGGITSSDIATKALGIRKAMVIGQALPGVPAWRCGDETRYPGTTYIVFPGNVGEDDALAQIQKKVRQ
ncbi:MAG: hypothetical protein LJE64_01820 [Desulfofustis sp.]|jgi:uncharacterized protein YgbK (DUF1537 family)|nr:hypothetical protein [Desulfofustis sp.]